MESGRPPLLLTNLLNDLETICHLLVDRIAMGDTFNSYLLAAGAQQIVEDYLHRDPLYLSRGAARLERKLPGRRGRLTADVLRFAGGLTWRASIATPGDRRAARWRSDLASLVNDLAALEVDSLPLAGRVGRGSLETRARRLAARLPTLPATLRNQLIRLPACFRSFDQAPDDMETLAQRFAARWPHLGQPLTVVGIRSSGSYLAPFLAACLRRLGFVDVLATTIRPGQRWLDGEAELLRRGAHRPSLALLVDDPPLSWASVGDAARELVKLGYRPEEVVLLVPAFPATAERPPALAGYPVLRLPWQDWAISRRLQPEAVQQTLSELLEHRSVVLAVSPTSTPSAPVERGHGSAVFDVTVKEGRRERRLCVRARGVGVGYFGEHSLAVAARLPGWLPEIYGLCAGVLYEAWASPERRFRAPLTEDQVESIAAYVVERGRALPIDEDLGARVLFQGAAWLAGSALSGLFGRGSELSRPLAAALVQRILQVDAPAIIDGQSEVDRFAVSESGRALKTDFDAGVFTSADLLCFDPAYDLAQAAASSGGPMVGEHLRRTYQEATGRHLDPERWFLYQLLAINEMESERPPEKSQAARRLAPLLPRYYGEVLLDGLTLNASGPLCAVELDGALETTPLGFPATSPLGAMALRSLMCHGFRPLLTTGRSVNELRDRCMAYGAAGGVAEHGAVTYDRQRNGVSVLVGDSERRALQRLRSVLGRLNGIQLDERHSFSVRACQFDGGRSAPIDPALARRALIAASAAGVLRPVHGDHETDFAAVSVNRGTALQLLAHDLGVRPPAPRPLSFAVRGVGQRGVAAALAGVLGHRPGSCGLCAPPALTPQDQLLLELLSQQDAAGWQKARHALALLPRWRRVRSPMG